MCLLNGRGEISTPHPQLPHFQPIFLKLKTKKHVRDMNPHAKFGKDRFTGGVWANTQILAVHSGLPFFIFLFVYHFGDTRSPFIARFASIAYGMYSLILLFGRTVVISLAARSCLQYFQTASYKPNV